METDRPLLCASTFDPFAEHYGDVQDFSFEFMLFDCGGPLAINAAADLTESGAAAPQAVISSTGHSGSPDDLSGLQVDEDGDGDDIDDDDDAAAPAGEEHGDSGPLVASSAKARRDRSKTLISERKRRVRMKETLYELRSLVPTITKMDKASIIADAVMYVKDLQSQAKKLEEEISALESLPSPPREEEIKSSAQNPHSKANAAPAAAAASIAGGAKITQVNACEVGGGRFYVKVEGGGVQLGATAAAPFSLYAAMESLSSCFDIESSNFSLSSAGFVFIVTFKVNSQVGELSEEMNAACMELWVMTALLKEGFQLMHTSTSL